MDELAFLTLMLLINHRIPHVLVEFYECRFWAKNEGQSYPLIQAAKCHLIMRHHASITWIGGPIRASNRHCKGPSTWNNNEQLPRRLLAKGSGQWVGPLVGRSPWSADQWGRPPTFPFGEKLPGGILKAIHGATCAVLRPRCWFHPSINMRGGRGLLNG